MGEKIFSSFLKTLKRNRRNTEKPKNKVKKENKMPPSMTLSDIKLQNGLFGINNLFPGKFCKKEKKIVPKSSRKEGRKRNKEKKIEKER